MAKIFDAVSWIVIGMGIGLCLHMGFKIYEAQKLREEYQQERKAQLIKRMKYHGLDGREIVYEQRGKYYFIRNGKTCKL